MSSIILSILHLLRGLPPGDLASARRERAMEHLAAWLQEKAGQPKVWFCTRDDFASRLTEIIQNPNRLVQGSFDWCQYATALHILLLRLPDKVAAFATSVYDTGSGDLGGLHASVDSNLMNFDIAAYAAQAPGATKFPIGTDRCIFRSADWILLGTLIDTDNSAIDYEGPLDDYGARVPVTGDNSIGVLRKTGFFESVEKLQIPASMTAAQLRDRFNAERTDVLLAGSFDFFTLGTVSGGGHAASLVAPAELDGSQLKLRWWSFGDTLDHPEEVRESAQQITQVDQNLTFTATVSVATLRGLRFVALAKLKDSL